MARTAKESSAGGIPATRGKKAAAANLVGEKAADSQGRTPARAMRTLTRMFDSWYGPLFRTKDLNVPHWVVLRELEDRDDINQLELGRRSSLLPTTTVAVLDALENRGLIRRRRDLQDPRRQIVSITPQGEQVLSDLKPELFEGLAASVKGVTNEDLAAFWRVVHKIESNLSEMLDPEIAV